VVSVRHIVADEAGEMFKTGNGLTVIVRVRTQPVGAVYDINAKPSDKPETEPLPAPIVATVVLPDYHVPPEGELLNV
jgi:hypothetical protein